MPKEKSKHKYGDWLLKQEDEAGYFSYKREYINELIQEYWFPKMNNKYFIWIVLIDVMIAIILDSEIVWIISGIILILVSIAVVVMMFNNTSRRNIGEENYVRREFDNTYGPGKYDETIKKIEQANIVHKK